MLNQLVLSTLWYRLNTLAPAPGFLTHLRRLILEFFWSGMHWAPVGVLHLPLKEGGQGLKCLYTQVRVFRLQALHRLLYSAGSSTWSILAHAFLRHFQGLRYDRQIFYLCLRGFPRHLSGLPVFYQDLLRTWKLFLMTRSVAATMGADLLMEPLLHNPQLRVQVAESHSVHQRLVLAEVTRVGDLLDYDRRDWLDPLTLARRMGLSSPHTPRRVLQEVKGALTPAAPAYVNQALREGAPHPSSTPGPPYLSTGPLPCRSQQTPHPFTASMNCSRSVFKSHHGNIYTHSCFTPFTPAPWCPAPIQSCGNSCHLWRVSNLGGPACIPPWSRGPSGTSVGGSFTEL
ncbi:unnamed protein product [Eretmochelys imbricata]